MASETFSPPGDLHPDWSVPGNWSGGVVPGAGTSALINAVDASIDPQTALAASITLEGGAGLIGNGGGFSLTSAASLLATDNNSLFANGAIVNDGTIGVAQGATLNIVVDAGQYVAEAYGLAEPSFENVSSVVVSGGVLEIGGSEFDNTGTVYVGNAGVLSVAGGWVDGGQGNLAPGGEIDISGGGLASFADGVVNQDFVFSGPGTIVFGDPGDVSAVAITNFNYRDAIVVRSVSQAQTLLADGITFTNALPLGETLAIVTLAGAAEIIAQANNTVPPCFARGTRLLTPAGYVPVQDLRPGSLVVTTTGAAEPVRWIGWRTIDLTDHNRPDAIRPVRITAGALGEGVPAREVQLSPDHAVFMEGHLIPIKLLVNNASIVRDMTSLAVTYFHVELARHSVILAENLPVETYLDTGNRNMFENAAGAPVKSPVFGRGKQWDKNAFAPLCIAGPTLRIVRTKIFERLAAAGYRHQVMPDVTLTAGGRKISRSSGMAWLPCYRLPPGHGGEIAIRSATFVPAEMAVAAGDDEDWRHLGVGIRRIRLDDQIFAPREVAVTGFHPRASGDLADWTDGNATIAVPPETSLVALNILALPKAWLVMPGGG
jgi:hypothetical protein